METTKKYCPWVEKYRPKSFNDIIFDDINEHILNNMIKNNYFPNLLLYGPPGTGKTTTIVNLIKQYQQKNNQESKGLIIHLNASDERGIDIIRNQIRQFVESKGLFNKGLKFIILDEVDYMTKSAQKALTYLLHQNQGLDICFCLMCNYITKLNLSLKNLFICLRFNRLPKENIINFLKNIVKKEKISISDKNLNDIQSLNGSDIRSMINLIQVNQHVKKNNLYVIDDEIYNNIYNIFKEPGSISQKSKKINKLLAHYQMDVKNFFKLFISYMITNKTELLTNDIITKIKSIYHLDTVESPFFLSYMVDLFNSLYDQI